MRIAIENVNMPIVKKVLKGVLLAVLIIVIVFFSVNNNIARSHGTVASPQVVEITTGENMMDIGLKLADRGVISWRWYFVIYVWKENLQHRLVAGKYQVNGTMTIPEIVRVIIQGEVVPKGVTVVFPEGFDNKKIADRLNANKLPGDDFLELAMHPKPEWKNEFWFLKDIPEGASLEGFLFPDTYVFSSDVTGEAIVLKMLTDFENKFPDAARADIEKQKRSVFEIVTMASIVENEVRTESDRKMVADIFWRRITAGMPLQSDATVKYVRGENKVQHSFAETRVDSPYNTYINKGLPPGPIANPGLESLLATLAPTPNQYMYFLSDTTTGETIFSITFNEHVVNKGKHGL